MTGQQKKRRKPGRLLKGSVAALVAGGMLVGGAGVALADGGRRIWIWIRYGRRLTKACARNESRFSPSTTRNEWVKRRA